MRPYYTEDVIRREMKRKKLKVKLLVAGVSVLLVAVAEALATDSFDGRT